MSADPLAQAAAAAEAVITRMLDTAEGNNTPLHSAMVRPHNAGPYAGIIVLPIEADPLPLSQLAVLRLQEAFDEGLCVYFVASDEAVFKRMLHVLQMLASTVPPGGVS